MNIMNLYEYEQILMHINVMDECDKMTPLHLSIRYNCDTLAKFLLDRNDCKFDLVDDHGFTPLMYACHRLFKNEYAALELIKSGCANPGYVDEANNTALMTAVSCTNIPKVVLALLKSGCANYNQQNINGHTAFDLFMLYAKDLRDPDTTEIALTFIKQGYVDPYWEDDHGTTFLFRAYNARATDLVTAILDMDDCNINHRGNMGMTIFDNACLNHDHKLANKVLSRDDFDLTSVDEFGYNSLMRACENRMSSIAIKIIKTGKVYLQHIAEDSYTALLLACLYGASNVAIELIKSTEIDLNYMVGGHTAAMIACENERVMIIKYLIRHKLIADDVIYAHWPGINHTSFANLFVDGNHNVKTVSI